MGDVGVRDGRIVVVGATDEEARETFDATGLVVAPGFVDPHTHYDAQLFWDPLATPSNIHGVTTVIGGNCGFTLAPIRDVDADYIRRMMAQGRGHAARRAGAGRRLELDDVRRLPRPPRRQHRRERRLPGRALRAAPVRDGRGGHRLGRRPEQLGDDGRRAGASRSRPAGSACRRRCSRTHSDGDGQPVASRWADREELLALCAEVGRHEGTTLEGIVDGCLDQFADDEIDLLIDDVGRPPGGRSTGTC